MARAETVWAAATVVTLALGIGATTVILGDPEVGGEPRKGAKRHDCLPEGSQPNVL